jgi:hypothetical protein
MELSAPRRRSAVPIRTSFQRTTRRSGGGEEEEEQEEKKPGIQSPGWTRPDS